MSRSKKAPTRKVLPDPKYNNKQLAKLINRIMVQGKKSTAQSLVYDAFSIIEEREKKDPLEVFDIALKNITPQMEVRSRRVGGAAYQVPVPVKNNRGSSLALRWLTMEARKRSSKEHHTFAAKLAAEILDAYKGEGGAVQKKITAHKMADANKAFAHFRW